MTGLLNRRFFDEAVETAVLAQQEVTVVASVHGALPTIRGDHARLRQVLGNLIENAVKYSPEGGEVRLAAAAGNGAVRISVRDNGPGIPRDQQARIFEKFGRVTGEHAKPGTGLGLFIAQGLVAAMGGRLFVSSEEGSGSRFSFELQAAVPTVERSDEPESLGNASLDTIGEKR